MIFAAVLSALLLMTLIAFPRYLKPAVLCLGLVWGTTAAFVMYDWFQGGKRLEHVIATAALDTTCSDPASPLRVTIRNGNSVAVTHLTYTLEGFEPGFRVSVVFEPYQASNVRIEPDGTLTVCRAFRLRNNERVEPSRLEWLVTINSAEFD
ncbi:hypothetical protein [Agrobacterium tumefaciens]|uniref:hypothetical protein n=1 Tax=Agrobacterium tumefaciens TaxID=358 RepID=UPI00287DBE60|nr:hypothetical protein [Agrobacterium tumefaciens]MDS7597588.1 hypothetical protein [Agrobacterium tumefaciens]